MAEQNLVTDHQMLRFLVYMNRLEEVLLREQEIFGFGIYF